MYRENCNLLFSYSPHDYLTTCAQGYTHITRATLSSDITIVDAIIFHGDRLNVLIVFFFPGGF